jgi:hypothetical protein
MKGTTMDLHDAIGYIGTLDNASGQVCQMKDGKPYLLLFELACGNCSEVESRNADDMGEALVTIVNAAPDLLAACEAVISNPYGCPFCDSGTLRTPNNPAKDHNPDCPYVLLRAAVRKARGE